MFFVPHIIRTRHGCDGRKGFALVEVLVIVVIFAIVGLAFANIITLGYKMRQRMIHRSVALQIASDEMERQTRLRATGLTLGTTTTTVTSGAMRFQQDVTISAAAAGGFDIEVSVTDLNLQIGGTLRLQNTLIPYGST